MKLDAVEFIRRFLLHVLPAGFMKIRHFGLLANRSRRQAVALCRARLSATTSDLSTMLNEQQKSALNRCCPQCRYGTLHVIAHIPLANLGARLRHLPPIPSTLLKGAMLPVRSTAAVINSALAALCLQSLPRSLRKLSSRFNRFTTATRNQPIMADFGPSGPQSTVSILRGRVQSPYIHRASGLLQIAVSTPLRTNHPVNTRIPACGAPPIRH